MKLDIKTLEKLIKEEIKTLSEISKRPSGPQDEAMIYDIINKRLSNLKQSIVGQIDDMSESIADEASHHWNLDVSPEEIQNKILKRLAIYFNSLASEKR